LQGKIETNKNFIKIPINQKEGSNKIFPIQIEMIETQSKAAEAQIASESVA